jgi:hypothetical protein
VLIRLRDCLVQALELFKESAVFLDDACILRLDSALFALQYIHACLKPLAILFRLGYIAFMALE